MATDPVIKRGAHRRDEREKGLTAGVTRMELRRCLATCRKQRAPMMVTQSLETPMRLLAMNGMPSQGLSLTVF